MPPYFFTGVSVTHFEVLEFLCTNSIPFQNIKKATVTVNLSDACHPIMSQKKKELLDILKFFAINVEIEKENKK